MTLEGGEGAGKSTQALRLAGSLAAAGLPVLRTREPGGAPGAEALRAVLLGRGPSEPWDPVTEALLHFAARREHLAHTLRPALAAGIWVVCDRFLDSTVAYQCFGQGVPRALVDGLAALTLDGLRPDLTLVLDLPPAIGLGRVATRGGADRYERMPDATHERIRAGFRAIAAAEPERCELVEAARPPDVVAASLREAVGRRLGVPLVDPLPA
uniref:dTMP kinase n=1 Tax=Roseomonas acroporae TaxID=2937791 RepID=UPI0031F5D149